MFSEFGRASLVDTGIPDIFVYLFELKWEEFQRRRAIRDVSRSPHIAPAAFFKGESLQCS
jgi:hypothetical protein